MKIETLPLPENLTKKQVKDLKKLQDLSVEFESYFMKEAVKGMRDTVPENDLINGGNAEKIYRSMYDDEMSKTLAGRGSSGIAKAIFAQMSKAYLASGAEGFAKGMKEE